MCPVLRADVMTGLVERVTAHLAGDPWCRVAVDGADGAGKSRFATTTGVLVVDGVFLLRGELRGLLEADRGATVGT